ncbi:MAG: YihY/virulence factor BrkB family protein [Actinomycetota bacterium]|nr:YihY/virulence factor BrkB family protein [Actinomycetota bacterium]
MSDSQQDEPGRPNLFARIKSRSATHWAGLKARHRSLAHVVTAWARLSANNGGQYAAAITYFSFLALFPLILLVVAITGFVLHAHPAAQQSLFNHITDTVPGSFGNTLKSAIQTAITQRAGVGLVGLVGVLLTGLGWIGNLRAAINAVWGLGPVEGNFFAVKAKNLLVLGGLGLSLLISLGLTAVGTALTSQIVHWLGLGHVAGMHVVLSVLGVALAAGGDVVIFWWLLVRLPAVRVSRQVALRGALLAAVGFEILKIVGTFTIARSAHSPTAGPFAGIVAVLIWIQLVARYMLFCTAWTATGLGMDGAAAGVDGVDAPAQTDRSAAAVLASADPPAGDARGAERAEHEQRDQQGVTR